MARGFEIPARARERVHATLREPLHERRLLVVGDAVGGVGVRTVSRPPLRQPYPAAAEERVHAVQARPPVDVLAVVGVPVERDQEPAGLLAPSREERVERLRPRPGVEPRAVREDAFEVEEARFDAALAARASASSSARAGATASAARRPFAPGS